MKLAYILNIYPKLSETFIEREINELSKLIKFDIFALRYEQKKYDSVEYLFKENILIVLIKSLFFFIYSPNKFLFISKQIIKQLSTHTIKIIVKQYLFLLYVPSLLQKIKQKNIYHIHSHLGNATTVALFCKIFNPTLKFSFTAHASADIYVQPELIQLKCQHADLIITNSIYNRNFIISLCNHKLEHKIRIVRNGIELNTISLTSAKNNKLTILAVGRLVKFKGFESLIYVADILKNTIDFNLKIIGNGKEKENLKYLINRYSLNDKITLMDEMDNDKVISEIMKCDIFVMPSEIHINGARDGIPTVLIEAMSLGKPVIATYISGIHELVEDGVEGFLVPERAYDKFANAVIKLNDDTQLRDSFGKNARVKIEKQFEIGQNSRLLFKYFREISEN